MELFAFEYQEIHRLFTHLNGIVKYWEKFHLVELKVIIQISSKQQKIIYFWRFDLYQRPWSEEAGTRSSSSGS